MIRVCLVDDQTLVRQGVKSLLELADGIEVVAEASDGRQAIELIPQIKPDVVLYEEMFYREVLPVEIDAEHLREHINQWLQLRESVLIWQRASNSHQNLDQPLVHPAPGLNCPLPQTPLN